MDNDGGKNRRGRNQADEEDGSVKPVVPLRSQPNDIDFKATSPRLELAIVSGSAENNSTPSGIRQAKVRGPRLELASGSAEENSTPSRMAQAEVRGPRLELASDSVEENSTPSRIQQAEVRGPRVRNEAGSTRPGAVRLYGVYGATTSPEEDDDTDITVMSQDLDSNTIISTPLLEAELAPDIDAVVEHAFQKHIDAAAAQALQNQAATLQQQQENAHEEMENGRNDMKPVAEAIIIVEQPKLCGVVPRRHAVFGFLVILVVAMAATLAVVLSGNKEPKNEPTTSPVTTGTPAPVSVALPDAPTSAPSSPPTNAPETHFAVRTQLDRSMCLDVQSSSTDDFTPLQVLPCNGSPAQMFMLLSTGEIKSALGNGRSCVEGDPDPSFEDAVFLYSPCYDTWTVNTDGTVVNEGDDRQRLCLAFDGSAVSVQQCDGGDNQKWSFDQLQL
jgi:hypothetical protein